MSNLRAKKAIEKMGGYESFPFLSPFEAFLLTILGKERILSFPKMTETFPSCKLLLSWERKGSFPFQERILSFPKITETFPSCSFPKIADTFPSCNQGKDLSTPCLLQLRWQLRHFQCQFQAFQFLW